MIGLEPELRSAGLAGQVGSLTRTCAFATGVLFLTCACVIASDYVEPKPGLCGFDHEALTFKGSPTEQAKCLLRPVKQGAALGEELRALPPPFDAIVGQPFHLQTSAVRTYLWNRNILEAEVGGSLGNPVSSALSNDPLAPAARYFVLHDTSTPNCSHGRQAGCSRLGQMPAKRDTKAWPWNDERLVIMRTTPSQDREPVGHVFIGRTGISKTALDFSEPWRATQLEKQDPSYPARGLFLHIESVQPRIGLPAVPDARDEPNDLIAPTPGFTQSQYERLALVYVAASARRGEWLVPAFHAVLDHGIGTHDDPQNFDLAAWGAALTRIIEEIGPDLNAVAAQFSGEDDELRSVQTQPTGAIGGRDSGLTE
jgi:hypothetical protein